MCLRRVDNSLPRFLFLLIPAVLYYSIIQEYMFIFSFVVILKFVYPLHVKYSVFQVFCVKMKYGFSVNNDLKLQLEFYARCFCLSINLLHQICGIYLDITYKLIKTIIIIQNQLYFRA